MNKKVKLLLVIIWMAFIFIMSSFNSNISSNQSNFIVDIILHIIDIKNIELLDLIIRKLAHFTEYFILGALLINLFVSKSKYIFYTALIGGLYAISDELHQSFVSGRVCSIYDILIDISGIIMAIICYKAYKNLTNRKK